MFNYLGKIYNNGKQLLLYFKFKLKNIKFKTVNQNSQMNSGEVRIISYTDKSFVVIGDTKPHKDSIKNLGGKWNASLTNKETGEKFMGWIFFLNKGKKNEVQSWIDNGCLPVNNKEENEESKRGFEKILFPPKTETAQPQVVRKISLSPVSVNSNNDRVSQLENTVLALLARIETLEAEVRLLKETKVGTKVGTKVEEKATPKAEEYEFEEVEVEEEVEVPVQNKRLLRR